MTNRELAEKALSGQISSSQLDAALKQIEQASGLTPPAPPTADAVVAAINESRREFKFCELCGGNFTRAIGSTERDCPRHRNGSPRR